MSKMRHVIKDYSHLKDPINLGGILEERSSTKPHGRYPSSPLTCERLKLGSLVIVWKEITSDLFVAVRTIPWEVHTDCAEKVNWSWENQSRLTTRRPTLRVSFWKVKCKVKKSWEPEPVHNPQKKIFWESTQDKPCCYRYNFSAVQK